MDNKTKRRCVDKPMTESTAERIATALERLALAMESINWKTPNPPPVPTPYTYPDPGGTAIPISPTTLPYPNIIWGSGSVSGCGQPTGDGTCWLNRGHSGDCAGARVINGVDFFGISAVYDPVDPSCRFETVG